MAYYSFQLVQFVNHVKLVGKGVAFLEKTGKRSSNGTREADISLAALCCDPRSDTVQIVLRSEAGALK